MSLRGGVRCIYLYIVFRPYVRGLPAYLPCTCTIYCGLWPPWNISCYSSNNGDRDMRVDNGGSSLGGDEELAW